MYVGSFIEKSPVQIYKSVKEQTSFCGKVDFYNMLKIGRFLHDNNISFIVFPEIPLIHKFTECFPDYADDYEWVLRKIKNKS